MLVLARKRACSGDALGSPVPLTHFSYVNRRVSAAFPKQSRAIYLPDGRSWNRGSGGFRVQPSSREICGSLFRGAPAPADHDPRTCLDSILQLADGENPGSAEIANSDIVVQREQ